MKDWYLMTLFIRGIIFGDMKNKIKARNVLSYDLRTYIIKELAYELL